MEEDQQTKLQLFKDEVSPLITESYLFEWFDDTCCARYLEARDWDVPEAVKLIKSSIKWRTERRPESTPCPLCLEDPLAHNLRMIGFDSENRPVLYTCFSQAAGRHDVPANVTHLCKTLEDTIKIMKKMDDGRWVWVIDFDGFGMSDCSIPMMNQTLQLMDHYPSRLGKLILLDSPWLFSGLWKTVGPLVPQGTKSKIMFISPKEVDSKLQSILGDELTAWLKREMAENRIHNKSNPKKYWEWLDEDGNPLPHDPRGTTSFVSGPHYKLPINVEFCSSLQKGQVEGNSNHDP